MNRSALTVLGVVVLAAAVGWLVWLAVSKPAPPGAPIPLPDPVPTATEPTATDPTATEPTDPTTSSPGVTGAGPASFADLAQVRRQARTSGGWVVLVDAPGATAEPVWLAALRDQRTAATDPLQLEVRTGTAAVPAGTDAVLLDPSTLPQSEPLHPQLDAAVAALLPTVAPAPALVVVTPPGQGDRASAVRRWAADQQARGVAVTVADVAARFAATGLAPGTLVDDGRLTPRGAQAWADVVADTLGSSTATA